jgi:hypothetical protein
MTVVSQRIRHLHVLYSRFAIETQDQYVRFQKVRSLGGCSAVIFGKVRSSQGSSRSFWTPR